MCTGAHTCTHIHTQFYLNDITEYKLSLWTPFFKKCAAFFLTLHTAPTKVIHVNNLAHIIPCLPPCLHNYFSTFILHTDKGCFKHFILQQWHPSVCTTTSCFSDLTIHHGNHLILLNGGIKGHGLDVQFTQPYISSQICLPFPVLLFLCGGFPRGALLGCNLSIF